jgi:hypothetical protein
MRRKFIIVVSAAMLLGALSCDNSPTFVVRSGVVFSCWAGSSFSHTLESETSDIPLRLGAWRKPGVILQSSGWKTFDVVAKHFLPSTPSELGSSWREQGFTPEDAVNGLAEKPVTVQGGRWFWLGLSDSDPIGEYRLELTIDNSIVKAVRFQVFDGQLPGALPNDSKPPPCSAPAAQQGDEVGR